MDDKMTALNAFYRGRSVLVTGHSGFVGGWLTLWLHSMGATVVGLSAGVPTSPSLYEAAGIDDIATSVWADIRDTGAVREAVNRYSPSIVFHLAGQAILRNSHLDPVETFGTNVLGTASVLEAAADSPSVKAFILASSDKYYKEDDQVHGESAERSTDNPYGASKVCAELVVATYRSSDKWRPGGSSALYATARPGNAVGGGDWAPYRVVPDVIRSLVEDKPISLRKPDAVRPWQHVLEPVAGYLLLGQRLIESGAPFDRAYNFGPAAEPGYPVRAVVDLLTSIWRSVDTVAESAVEPMHEAESILIDSALAARDLGWQPTWDLASALTKTVEWYKACYAQDDADLAALMRGQIASFAESFGVASLRGTA